jgi:ABC-type antimicrobial peptide transport system permease subunit
VPGSSIPRLLLGALAALLAAGAYPALRATRQEPVDVLGPKGS